MSKILIFLARIVGFHFVEENYKAAVMRLGMYHRVRGPGFVWVAPLIEKIENYVRIGMRLTAFTVKRVLTKDGVPLDFELTIRYRFDPDSTSRSIAAQLVRQPDHVLEGIVQDHADRSLRRAVAGYSAEDICYGEPVTAIEQAVIQGLETQVKRLGLAPMAGGGVMIKEIIPPKDFLETILAAKGHEIILRVLTAYQATDVDQALFAEWVRGFKEAPPTFLSSFAELLQKFSKAERREEQ